MKSKKFLSIICAVVMMFALSIAVVQTKHVSAAETTKYYYGTSLVTSDSGSPSITSSLSEGVKVTFKKENKSASVKYKHSLYAQNLEITFKSTKTNFEQLWFTVADADNDTKWVKVSFKQVDGKIHYALEDNENNKTEYANSGVDASKLADGVKLSLSNGTFKLDTATLSATNIVTKSFYKNMAKLSYGVEGVDSEGEDAIVCITKINDQSLVTANSKFEGNARVNPVIIPMQDGEDEPVETAVSQNVNAPANEDYTFAYYCLDVLGTGWAVKVGDSDKVSGKTTQAVGEVGSQDIVAKIYVTDASEQALITLNITAVEDETSVTINDSAFENFYKNADELKNVFGTDAVGHMVATTEGNTFEFPHVYNTEFAAIYGCTDGIDGYNNVKIQVGYKAPGDNGNYTYASSYAVKLNETGVWYFVYKATDVAGNETVSKPFSFRVVDETAPTIKVSEKTQIIVDEKYTIPSATITDNASGVDSNYTKWTLYEADADGKADLTKEIKNVKFGEEGYDESLLKDGVFTPTETGKKYVVVYEARDKADNVATSQQTVIEVIEGTPTYTANPFNDFVKTSLIVVACLAGLGLIVLIFVRPKQTSLK